MIRFHVILQKELLEKHKSVDSQSIHRQEVQSILTAPWFSFEIIWHWEELDLMASRGTSQPKFFCGGEGCTWWWTAQSVTQVTVGLGNMSNSLFSCYLQPSSYVSQSARWSPSKECAVFNPDTLPWSVPWSGQRACLMQGQIRTDAVVWGGKGLLLDFGVSL